MTTLRKYFKLIRIKANPLIIPNEIFDQKTSRETAPLIQTSNNNCTLIISRSVRKTGRKFVEQHDYKMVSVSLTASMKTIANRIPAVITDNSNCM